MCSKEEVEKIVGEMEARVDKKILKSQEEIEAKIFSSHNEVLKQVHKMAPETRTEISNMRDWIKTHEETTKTINLALFGDPTLKIEGMIETSAKAKAIISKVYLLIWVLTLLLAPGGFILTLNGVFHWF